MPAEQSIRDIPMEGREFEGSLRVFKFPEVLQFLALGKRSGTLELSQDNRRVYLSFHDGRIVSVNAVERSMRLGQMLLYSGQVTREALDKALETQDLSGGTKFLGEILLEQGAVQSDPLKEALTRQLQEDIWDLFSWDNGNFKFDQTAVRGTSAIEVGLETAPLISEGQRRMQEWLQISQTISDPQEIMRVNPEFTGGPDQPFDEKVWRVLSLINGRLTVESLVRISNIGKFATYSALDQLLRSEVILRGVSDPTKDYRAIRPASGPGISGAATIRLNAAEMQPEEPVAADAKGKKNSKSGKGFMGLLKGGSEAKPDSPVSVPKECLTDVALVCAVVNAMTRKLVESGVIPSASSFEIVGWMWRMAEQRFPRADMLELHGSTLNAELYDRYARLEGGISRALAGVHDDCLEAMRAFWNRLREKAVEGQGGEKESQQTMDKVLAAFASTPVAIATPDFNLNRWRDGTLGPAHVAPADASRRRR